MKKILVVLLIMSLVGITQAQTAGPKTETGVVKGTSYKIILPGNWKGKLIMFAHGYDFVGTPRKQSENPQFENLMKPFLDRGFAVAASDYSKQGFAFAEGVDETESLRAFFFEKYGRPDTTFMVGYSMGGGITLATIENFGKNYAGGLPLCPLSSRPYLQCRKEFDMYAIFNGLYPGLLPSLKEIFDVSQTKPGISFAEMTPKAAAIKSAILKKDSLGGIAFAKHFSVKFDDLPFSLLFNENVLRDVAQKAKGNPFDNTNTLYSGFLNDLEVNQKAERLAATVQQQELFGKYDRTGNIDKPVLLMHTVYDQLIPPTYGEVNFENMVFQKNKGDFFVVKYTNGAGHCQFTPQQVGQAFDELRRWTKTGKKAVPGYIP